jgi:3-hydroxybutyryl-CoA dehydrogenase
MLYVRKVGVVGSGAMGSQIAEIMALNGYEVYLKDISKEFLDKGMARIKKSFGDLVLFHKTKADREISRIKEQDGITLSAEQAEQVRAKLKPTYDEKRVSEILARIHPTEGFEPFKDVEIVVEAIIEEIQEKKKLFKELDQVAQKAVLATNTSTLSITQIASVTKRRDRVVTRDER